MHWVHLIFTIICNDIKTVKTAIVQPRLDNISEWEISVDELLEWAENTLKPIAELAAKGEGEFKGEIIADSAN